MQQSTKSRLPHRRRHRTIGSAIIKVFANPSKPEMYPANTKKDNKNFLKLQSSRSKQNYSSQTPIQGNSTNLLYI